MRLRKVLFWLHLIAGLVAGVVILIMSVTGAALAFEKEIIACAERDVRRVTPPAADAKPLPLDELLARAREAKPGERPSGITLEADPGLAMMVSFGRTNAFYVNPYTGAVREQEAKGTRVFMQAMIEWHRYLGGQEKRALGKAVTGACNAAFLFLAVSGLYLWWPRQWAANTLRAIGLMNFKLSGKARDWNWHNAVGLWTAPVLIVLTATAMPISYQWAGNLIYRITGSPLPAPGTPPGASGPAVELPTPPEGAKPLGLAAMFEAAQKAYPNWKQISQRTAGPGRSTRPVATSGTPAATGVDRPSPQPITLAVIEHGQWPLFTNTQLALDPFTGAVLRKESFGDANLGRQVRSWTRFLHTGEALGIAGKALAGAALGAAALLVWTGFALAWRRFFPRRGQETAETTTISAAQTAAKE